MLPSALAPAQFLAGSGVSAAAAAYLLLLWVVLIWLQPVVKAMRRRINACFILYGDDLGSCLA